MKHHKQKQPPGQRQLRVGEEIRHAISKILQRGGFDDERLINSGLVTTTEVRISPDLKNATVFVMPLGGRDADVVLPALNEHAYFFQKELARQIKMKFTPKLKFELDDSFDEGDKIERLIKDSHISEQNEPTSQK